MPRVAKVIVVTLIFVMLIALAMVGVNKAREAASNTQCMNNLKQFALVLHNFHDCYRVLPPATLHKFPPLVREEVNWPPEERLSWIVAVVPFMESRMDLRGHFPATDKRWFAPENDEVVKETLLYCVCPARPDGENAINTSYVGIAGVGGDAAALPRGDPRIGVFGYDRLISFKDVTDGNQFAIAIAETLEDNGPWAAGGAATARGLDDRRGVYLGQKGQFTSKHSLRTNVAFLDASVQSFTTDFDPRVFEALATIAGGEKIEPWDE